MTLLRRTLSAIAASVLQGALAVHASAQDAGAQAEAIGVDPSSTADVASVSQEPAYSDRTWADVVDRLSQVLTAGDGTALSGMISESAPITPFARQKPSGFASLLSDTRGRVLVSSRAYETSTAAMATDLASDFNSADAVPVELRKLFTPDNEPQARRANLTAAQWARAALEASLTDPIALVVVYDPQATDVAPRARLRFVLVKGVKSADGLFHIARIVFGNPLESVPPG